MGRLRLTPDLSATGNGHALLSTPDKSLIYHVRQKNTSNPIHLLSPAMTIVEDDGDAVEVEQAQKNGKEVLGICSIGIIDDTLELYPFVEAGEAKQEKVGGKVNKWHEKFAKGRAKWNTDVVVWWKMRS